MRTFISSLKYLELKGEFVLRKQIGNYQNCGTNSKVTNLSSFFEGSKMDLHQHSVTLKTFCFLNMNHHLEWGLVTLTNIAIIG
jgi:hypothetical protein